MNLKDWEIKTIEALAREAFDRESEKTEIRHPEAWLEKAIRDRQADALNKEQYRAQLQRHADRLVVGHIHPPRDWQQEKYDVATPETAARWQRIIGLVLTVPRSHPWRTLHYELVTKELLAHRHDRNEKWEYPNHGFDALDALEAFAIEHGLMTDERVTKPNPQLLAAQIKGVFDRIPGPPAKVPWVEYDEPDPPKDAPDQTLAERLLAMVEKAA